MVHNCIEWVLIDLACLKLGAVVAGFEVGRFEAATIVAKYGLKLLFVDRADHSNARIIDRTRIGGWAAAQATAPFALHGGYGAADVCAIKFTSGSTGEAKGLEATVGSIDDSISSVQAMFSHAHGDNILVFLRLALLQQRYWIYSALAFGHDVTITNTEDVVPMARAVNPTVIMGVPGFYEDVKRSVETGAGYDGNDRSGRRRGVEGALGSRIRYLWTGSAPAGRPLLDFYNDCGVALYEGYGLNETCIVAKNCPGAFRIGSVGKPLPNKFLRFAGDGVLIVGSSNPVNTRYAWCAPGDNERTFLPSGEVNTNDLAFFDADGFLYIRGRVDDIVTLSSGRNVLVRPLEERLKRHSGIHDCILCGTGRPYLTAIVSRYDASISESQLEKFLGEMNEATLPEQQIRGLVIASEQFSIENGLLTSQFKTRRSEIVRRYARELESVYSSR
jgi:long-chain acyl-CoA synthetase